MYKLLNSLTAPPQLFIPVTDRIVCFQKLRIFIEVHFI